MITGAAFRIGVGQSLRRSMTGLRRDVIREFDFDRTLYLELGRRLGRLTQCRHHLRTAATYACSTDMGIRMSGLIFPPTRFSNAEGSGFPHRESGRQQAEIFELWQATSFVQHFNEADTRDTSAIPSPWRSRHMVPVSHRGPFIFRSTSSSGSRQGPAHSLELALRLGSSAQASACRLQNPRRQIIVSTFARAPATDLAA